jgi:hypothetical protein
MVVFVMMSILPAFGAESPGSKLAALCAEYWEGALRAGSVSASRRGRMSVRRACGPACALQCTPSRFA